MNVTRHVISDLWPIYASGEASADTRALVEAFLATNPSFAATLRESDGLAISCGVPALPPGHEIAALDRTRRQLWGFGWWLRFAVIFSCFAFARILSDTSFDVSPRPFIAVASVAAACWIAFCVSLYRNRARILIVPSVRPATR